MNRLIESSCLTALPEAEIGEQRSPSRLTLLGEMAEGFCDMDFLWEALSSLAPLCLAQELWGQEVLFNGLRKNIGQHHV